MQNINTFLLVIDAMRADHLQYNGGDSLTPNLTALAKESVAFSNCFAQGVSSSPSMASLLTSTYPLDYGGHWYLSDSRQTIAELLKENGYSTAAIHTNPNVSRLRNFNKGFDYFDENLLPTSLSGLLDYLPVKALRFANKFFRLLHRQPYLSAQNLNQKILHWIGEARQPFFIWTQFMDVHGPYLSHRGNPYLDKWRAELLYQKAIRTPHSMTPQKNQELRESYQAEVRYVDEHIGALIEQLKSKGLWDEMLVIITADHGDEFGEHGLFGHNNNPYDELIRVPLLIKLPRSMGITASQLIDEPVRLLELVPTILEVLGIIPNEMVQKQLIGKSLMPLMRQEEGNDESHLFDFIITENEIKHSDKLRLGIRTQAWKFIFDGQTDKRELYDLNSDPNEKQNVLSDYPDVAEYFEELLNQRLSQIAERSANIKIPDVIENEEVEERLKALGYL